MSRAQHLSCQSYVEQLGTRPGPGGLRPLRTTNADWRSCEGAKLHVLQQAAAPGPRRGCGAQPQRTVHLPSGAAFQWEPRKSRGLALPCSLDDPHPLPLSPVRRTCSGVQCRQTSTGHGDG